MTTQKRNVRVHQYITLVCECVLTEFQTSRLIRSRDSREKTHTLEHIKIEKDHGDINSRHRQFIMLCSILFH